MRIDRDGDDVSMVLSKQDMIDLKAMFDSHLMIPKYSIYGKPQPVIATTSVSTSSIPSAPTASSLWPGVKNWYKQQYNQQPQAYIQPLPEPKVEDTHEILGKLIRAFDLILENKNTGGKEIE